MKSKQWILCATSGKSHNVPQSRRHLPYYRTYYEVKLDSEDTFVKIGRKFIKNLLKKGKKQANIFRLALRASLPEAMTKIQADGDYFSAAFMAVSLL